MYKIILKINSVVIYDQLPVYKYIYIPGVRWNFLSWESGESLWSPVN